MNEIGVIGLGVMGANIARNLASRKIKTAVYNRTFEKTKEFLNSYQNEFLKGEEQLENFVLSLEKPRKILLMVQAGSAVDMVIDLLLPFLQPGDIVIDGGNSEYRETIRRGRNLQEKNLHFIGMGVSGGEEGALHGPSLMPGGAKEIWPDLQPILEKIAAKDFSGKPCVTHIGTDGAGHFIKMIHNGIEYAIMQLLAEVYEVLRKVGGYEASEIADLFEKLGSGKLRSFLLDIVVPVLRKNNDQGEGYLIDFILDKAGQKGTGGWTVIEALQKGVALSAISEAVFARNISGEKDLRVKLSTMYRPVFTQGAMTQENFQHRILPSIENALYLGIILAYAQGFHLIQKTAKEQNWQINLAEISRIWQGGCIIRSDLLILLQQVFEKNPNLEHLLAAEPILNTSQDSFKDLQTFCSYTASEYIAIPCFSACFNYFISLTSEKLPANLIQGLRDFFGAHTFERTDREGTFHQQWL